MAENVYDEKVVDISVTTTVTAEIRRSVYYSDPEDPFPRTRSRTPGTTG